MSRTIRFHLDENVDPDAALGLRRRGVDVTTSQDAGLLAASDVDQLAFATSERRVLFTHDDHHLKLNATGVAHAGIVYSKQRKRTIGEMIADLTLIWEVVSPDQIENRVEFI